MTIRMTLTTMFMMKKLLLLMLLLEAPSAVAKLVVAEAHVRHVERRGRVDVDPMAQPSAETVRTTSQEEEEQEEEEEEYEENAGASNGSCRDVARRHAVFVEIDGLPALRNRSSSSFARIFRHFAVFENRNSGDRRRDRQRLHERGRGGGRSGGGGGDAEI